MALLLVLFSDAVVPLNGGHIEPAAKINSRNNMRDNNEQMLQNVPKNERISPKTLSSVAVRPNSLNNMSDKPINDDVRQQHMTNSSPDNDYHSIKRAFDTFNEKMEIHMNFYGNEITFITTKLNQLKEKLNTLEILQHEIDQIMNRQNAADQKLQMIQEAMFGSQSISSKLDRLEFSMQQLHVQIDELMDKQHKFTPQTVPTKQKKENDDRLSDSNEQFQNCESKIEQLVGFIHSFAELNRLESTDILNRLGNMQSQMIQLFDAKGMITSTELNQKSTNDTTEQGVDILKETTPFSNYINDTNATNVTNESIPSDGVTESTRMPTAILNLNQDISNVKFIRKRKRMTNMVS